MPTKETQPSSLDERRQRLKIGLVVVPVILLATAPYAFFSLGKSLLLSVTICVLGATALLMMVGAKPNRETSSSSENRSATAFTGLAIYLSLALLFSAAAIGVFFQFAFWKALLFCVAISLGGGSILTVCGFGLLALNRGFLEKQPIDPDAPR